MDNYEGMAIAVPGVNEVFSCFGFHYSGDVPLFAATKVDPSDMSLISENRYSGTSPANYWKTVQVSCFV